MRNIAPAGAERSKAELPSQSLTRLAPRRSGTAKEVDGPTTRSMSVVAASHSENRVHEVRTMPSHRPKTSSNLIRTSIGTTPTAAATRLLVTAPARKRSTGKETARGSMSSATAFQLAPKCPYYPLSLHEISARFATARIELPQTPLPTGVHPIDSPERSVPQTAGPDRRAKVIRA